MIKLYEEIDKKFKQVLVIDVTIIILVTILIVNLIKPGIILALVLLVFILTMFASFMLFACGEDKLVIEFDTAGGNAISNVELELDKLGDFKLPEVPVKEGFEFKGWYLDAEFKNEFKSLEGFEGTVKLYAKWEEVPADPTQTYKVSFYVDGNLVDTFEGMGLALVYPEVEAKDGKAFMTKADKMISDTNRAFSTILDSLYQSDIMDAAADMKVYDLMLKADGIVDDNPIMKGSGDSEK